VLTLTPSALKINACTNSGYQALSQEPGRVKCGTLAWRLTTL